ncbi:glycine cleavage system aminomethyltransferase GcvT [bacterium]|nr:glycine cleavage system aminomethyltransferase GcvT [bacterium]
MTGTLFQTPLTHLHKTQGAKCVGFANYEMPMWFSTMKDEHLAVRQQAGMFDVSHMGLFEISGENADAFMQRLSCNSIKPALNAKMIYSMFLNEKGMILDDVMFGKYDSKWFLVVNGSNRSKLEPWMNAQSSSEVMIKELNSTHAFIAVQGPTAISILEKTLDIALQDLGRFKMTKVMIKDAPCLVTRTGYTGEDGVELVVPSHKATSIWETLQLAGVTPCGLAARDSLRIEYGLPLYGQELSESIHPYMTRYAWVVKPDCDFIGNEALKRLKQSDSLQAVALHLDGSLISRPQYPINEGGHITSGTLSPITGKSIALAFVPKEYAQAGQTVTVKIRKHDVKATVCDTPFI